MKVLGLDPGKNGALTIIDTLSNEVFTHPISKLDGRIDVKAIGKFLFTHKPDIAYVEQVHGMPKHSSKGNFTFGLNHGLVLACLYFMDIPVTFVAPVTWKINLFGSRTGNKTDAINFVQSNYQTVNLIPKGKRVPHDGIADSVCIAHYGIIKLNANN